MKTKQIFKMAIDILMTALFLILMGYHITGNHLHEWLGATLFVLFIVHHILNRKWYCTIGRGKYTAFRIFMLLINSLLFASMIGMMVSGMMLSREVFGFLNFRAGMFGRRLHMISTSWGFCLMSVHIGIHWGMVVSKVKKVSVKKKWMTTFIQGVICVINIYGIYAFISRRVGERMLLLVEYAFFDYNESAVFFYADYVCIMIFFATLSYYLAKILRKKKRTFPNNRLPEKQR